MLEEYFESAFTLKQLRNGPSGPWLRGFAQSLHEDDYSWWTARTYLRAAHHLGHFLKSQGVALVAVQPDTIAEFRRHLKRCRCPSPGAERQKRLFAEPSVFSDISGLLVLFPRPRGSPGHH